MSETTEEPKVINLRTGKAFEAPPAEKQREIADDRALELLNQVHEAVEAGDNRGLLVIFWDEKSQGFETRYLPPVGENIVASTAKYLGGLELSKQVLLSFVMQAGGMQITADAGDDDE